MKKFIMTEILLLRFVLYWTDASNISETAEKNQEEKLL